jgi:hypothetical protein
MRLGPADRRGRVHTRSAEMKRVCRVCARVRCAAPACAAGCRGKAVSGAPWRAAARRGRRALSRPGATSAQADPRGRGRAGARGRQARGAAAAAREESAARASEKRTRQKGAVSAAARQRAAGNARSGHAPRRQRGGVRRGGAARVRGDAGTARRRSIARTTRRTRRQLHCAARRHRCTYARAAHPLGTAHTHTQRYGRLQDAHGEGYIGATRKRPMTPLVPDPLWWVSAPSSFLFALIPQLIRCLSRPLRAFRPSPAPRSPPRCALIPAGAAAAHGTPRPPFHTQTSRNRPRAAPRQAPLPREGPPNPPRTWAPRGCSSTG